jgi:cell division FtsZ-interacting protein ZapD
MSESDYLDNIPEGEVLKCKISRPRNSQHHRKFFALLNIVYQNQDHYNSIDVMRSILTMKAGFYNEIKTDKGLVFLPASISFAKMDQQEFNQFYEKMLMTCCDFLGTDKEELINEIKEF